MVGTTSRKGRIRAAKPEEAATISALALRSKAHWGYARSFLEAAKETLTLTPADIDARAVNVMELNGEVIGFYGLSIHDDDSLWLDYLFIDPGVIGYGFGKKLWRHAVVNAGTLNHSAIFLECDRYSRPFYERMGAVCIAQIYSPYAKGERLPIMRYAL